MSTAKLVILLALLLAAGWWTAALLFNVRGSGEKLIRSALRGKGWPRSMTPSMAAQDRHYRFAKVTQRIVMSTVLLSLLAVAAVTTVTLLGRLTR